MKNQLIDLRETRKKYELGTTYKVTIRNKDGTKHTRSPILGKGFTGELIQETDRFIVLIDKRGIKECFLKVDFITGEKMIEVI